MRIIGLAVLIALATPVAEAAPDDGARAETLLRSGRAALFADPAVAERDFIAALAIRARSTTDPYPAALIRIELAILRALRGDRAGQLVAIAEAARAMAAAALTPERRAEAAAALLTAAQFSDSAGARVAADDLAAAGLALLARPDTSQRHDAAEAYEIAADLATRAGSDARALALASRAAAIWEGDATPLAEFSRALGTAAEALLRLGRFAEAEPQLRRALAAADAARPLAPHLQVLALARLARYHDVTGHADLAAPLLGRALAIAESMPQGFRYALDVAADLVANHRERGDIAGARDQAEKAAAVAARLLGPNSPEQAALLLDLAALELDRGAVDRAAGDVEAAQAIGARSLAPSDPRRADMLAMAGRVAAARGASSEAARDLLAAVDGMATRPAGDPARIAAESDAAVQLMLVGDPAAWPHARAAADALTARLIEQAGLPGQSGAISQGDRAVFGRAVRVAWARAHPGAAATPSAAGGP